jgi:hypothetical protein
LFSIIRETAQDFNSYFTRFAKKAAIVFPFSYRRPRATVAAPRKNGVHFYLCFSAFFWYRICRRLFLRDVSLMFQ